MIFEVQLSSPYRVIRLEADSVYPSHDMIQFTVGNNVGHMFPASNVISVTSPLNVINSDVPAGISEGRRAVVTQDAPEFIDLLNRSQYAPAILSDSIRRPSPNTFGFRNEAMQSPQPIYNAVPEAAYDRYIDEEVAPAQYVRAPYTEAQALAHIGTAAPQLEVRAAGEPIVYYNNSTTRMDAQEADF